MQIDTDPSAGQSFTSINPITFFSGLSVGLNFTANGAGFAGPYETKTVAQNSFNFGDDPLFLATGVDATYDIILERSPAAAAFALAFAAADSDALSSIRIVVGKGGAPPSVPDRGGTASYAAIGLLGLVGFRRALRGAV